MNSSLLEAVALISKANKIIIVGHINPDGDVIGSMLGLGKALEKIGKQCQLVLPDELPTLFSFLPGITSVVCSPGHLETADTVITLDSSDFSRLGSVYTDNAQLFQSVPVLNIDHHVTNQRFGSVNWVDIEAAAVAEQVYLLIEKLGIPFDSGIATCLLTGIVADTRCFRTQSTQPRTMEIASELMRAGASLSQIVDWVYNTKKLSTLQLWVKVLSTLESSGGMVWAEVTQEMFDEVGARAEETDDLVSLIGGVREAKLALLFKENGNGVVKVSLRSNGEIDVAEAAAHFGGGGHPRAAGCTVHGTVAEAKEVVLSFLRRYMAKSSADQIGDGDSR